MAKPPFHTPLTPEQLHERAVERRDFKRVLQKQILFGHGAVAADLVFDSRAPHAHRGTAERKHYPRKNMRAAYLKQLRKEREIGVDPKYGNGLYRKYASKGWQARSREWDKVNA